MGYADAAFAAFMAQSQDDMKLLAWEYYWVRLGGLSMRYGADLSTIDWCWTSGGAVLEIQKMLDVHPLDGIMGPLTVGAINEDMLPSGVYIDRLYGARVAYYRDLGFEGVYPGLFVRAAACRDRSRLVGVV